MKRRLSLAPLATLLFCASFSLCSCMNDCGKVVDEYLEATAQKNLVVHFDANGGSGTMADQEIPATYTRKLNLNTFTRDYYAFAGWTTEQFGAVATLSDGAELTIGHFGTVLYAIWTRALPSPSSLSYVDLIAVPAATGDSYVQATGSSGGFAHNIGAFSLGKYEVTYELYYVVWEWAKLHGYTLACANQTYEYEVTGTAYTQITSVSSGDPVPTGKYRPATQVSWAMAVVWCNAYSEMTGYAPVYYTDSACTVPLRDDTISYYENLTAGTVGNPYVKWSSDGFRLPTAGEWQYAASCKGIYGYNTASGADAEYTVFAGASDTDGDGVARYTSDVAVYGNTNGIMALAAVGSKAPNIWGFYDMSGNAEEWCYDAYAYAFPTTAQTDYYAPISAETSRVLKGGGYYHMSGLNMTIGNLSGSAWGNGFNCGFRVCRRP